MMLGLLLAFGDDVSISKEHMALATDTSLWGIALLLVFFAVRPELWRRMFFDRVDPRPAALTRIAFGLVVLWTFLDLLAPHGPLEVSAARYLFTDDGLWLTDMARKRYGDQMGVLWDPEHGFEHWYDVFRAMWGKFTILHVRSDPGFVFGLYGLMVASLLAMIFGVWTRWTTLLAWILVETFYRYSPIFYTGGDTVVRVFLFLGVFTQWGEAYSIDSWRRRRKAILGGATSIPPLKKIPAWPLRLMMLQLTIIYCATGILKSGSTWMNGTALYYALNLDHFYRWPQTGPVTVAQYLGVLPAMTIFVRYWEVLFPLALFGTAINAFEREKAMGVWPKAAAWRRFAGYAVFAAAWAMMAYIAGLGAYYYLPPQLYQGRLAKEQLIPLFTALTCLVPIIAVGLYLGLRRWTPRLFDGVRFWFLGKRFWLVFGFGMHIGIDVGMNVGTFAEVMMAVYLAWLTGDEIDAFWRYVMSRPLAPGEGGRPVRAKKLRRLLLTPIDRLTYRRPGATYVVLHHPGEASVRRAALLRPWDLADRTRFEADDTVAPETLAVRTLSGERLEGKLAAAYLLPVLPGLWWLRPLRPLAASLAGSIAMRILRQRG